MLGRTHGTISDTLAHALHVDISTCLASSINSRLGQKLKTVLSF